ncbi:1-acyl-sn-glycerol-3-phosphate acyltransferase [hydrothermal vent metagenome]|uniref:1-acyl-sn-glycerol-3-phosphate acyltransferase n=1 Tax=hydrothermal vent metagenome TaxID=652676 RepID=A0A1W1D0D7_9ZZZZ
MNFNKIKLAIYALFLTNKFGLKLKDIPQPLNKKRIRLEYTKILLSKLKISVKVKNREKLPLDGQFLLMSNHRGIIDPLIVEVALEETDIFGLWISKKELYNSPFFGMFVRNAGSILLDREKSQMGGFFADIKSHTQKGSSIFIFPEGTRNKSEKELIEFKEGFRIIALKNRLPILPVFIRTHTNEVLGESLNNNKNVYQTVTIEIGDMIDYKERRDIEVLYKEMFGIDYKPNIAS